MYVTYVKYLVSICIVPFLLTKTYCQPNGYYINNEGDTLNARIKMPQGFLRNPYFEGLFRKVSIQQTGGETTTCKPHEIAAFSFQHQKKRFNFESVPRGRYHLFSTTFKDSVPSFMLVLNKGKQAAAYLYYETGTEESTTPAEYYTLTRSIDDEKLYLHNFGKLKPIRNKLIAFYGHLPSAEKAVKRKFTRHSKMRKDLVKFMETVNR